jgi:hypothetical protein
MKIRLANMTNASPKPQQCGGVDATFVWMVDD